MVPANFRRILFCNPPTGLYRRDDRCQCSVEDQTIQIIFPPNELATHAAVARQAGAEVRIEDYPAEKGDWRKFVSDLKDFQPTAVLLVVTTATLETDLQACRAAKDELGLSFFTIAKGEIFESMGEEILERWPELDLGLYGESEPALAALVSGEAWENVPGLLFRKRSDRSDRSEGSDRKIIRTPKPKPIQNLDDLPLPARDLLKNELYLSPETGRPLAVIHGNRGCPAKCIFCPAGPVSNYTLRLRSPESVLDEIEICVNEYGIRDFLFHGDTFTINKRWLMEICNGIVERKLKIHWGCNSRVDTIDDERAAAMKRAGCWVVAFGVESGVQEMLDKMKKGTKVERARDAFAICKRNGLRTHCFIVIGLPWETEETLATTFNFVKELDPDFFDLNIAYPLPGTELYEIAIRDGLVDPNDLRDKGYARAAMNIPHLSAERLNEWRKQALLKLYLRPKYIARTLYRAGSPRVAKNYAKAALHRFNQLVRTN